MKLELVGDGGAAGDGKRFRPAVVVPVLLAVSAVRAPEMAMPALLEDERTGANSDVDKGRRARRVEGEGELRSAVVGQPLRDREERGDGEREAACGERDVSVGRSPGMVRIGGVEGHAVAGVAAGRLERGRGGLRRPVRSARATGFERDAAEQREERGSQRRGETSEAGRIGGSHVRENGKPSRKPPWPRSIDREFHFLEQRLEARIASKPSHEWILLG